MVNNSDPQVAPGALEDVRKLLNSWLIPNHTRRPTDHIDAYATAHHVPPATQNRLRQLRDDLRAAVERPTDAAVHINAWIQRLGIGVQLSDGQIDFTSRGGHEAHILTTVLKAIADGTWNRLKTCPDCRWAFYDHTRNGSKRWCLMTSGGTGGRSCGSIAKVRRHRGKAAERRSSGTDTASPAPTPDSSRP